MNIEDQIRQANPVAAGDVEDAFSPTAQRTLSRILRKEAAPGPAPGRALHARRSAVPRGLHYRHGPTFRGRKRKLIMAGLAAAAAGAAAASLVLAVPGTTRRPAPGAAPGQKAHPSVLPGPAQLTTARQVLLAAAAHVPRTLATGTYWRVQEIAGLNFPGGTTAHPYDISLKISYDQWNPRVAGRKYWLISQQLGAFPATPADAAAWRAAGSPATWRSGQYGSVTLGAPWARPLAATTATSVPSATWTVSDGTVGYVEGDLAGLKAAQFRQMPTSPQGVAALLRHYYVAVGCTRHPGCSPEDQFIWSEALFLLQDPVSARVRSAMFRVMASLPGVRLVGAMTDPLGRRGYALATDSLEPGDNPDYHPVHAVVIDPRTGSLLATEDIAPMPRNVQCLTIGPDSGADRGKPVIKLPVGHGKFFTGTCIGPSYQGRSYAGQVDEFTVLVRAGWTNASPVLPSSTQQKLNFPGLPPAEGGNLFGLPPR